MELNPIGADILKIIWEIGGDRHELLASSCVGGQFSYLAQALYTLYSEGPDTHSHFLGRRGVKSTFCFPQQDKTLKENEVRVTSEFSWNGEGPICEVYLSRKCKDIVNVRICSYSKQTTKKTYRVDGRDLCYAAAKAYTETLKKHGVYGYFATTGGIGNGDGDIVDLHWLLFLKAYALDAMETRELKTVWKGAGWQSAEGTDFNKEMELLMFDM